LDVALLQMLRNAFALRSPFAIAYSDIRPSFLTKTHRPYPSGESHLLFLRDCLTAVTM